MGDIINKSEIKGYNWLLSKGYKESEINFRVCDTPDFITLDGSGWEIKRVLKKNKIYMSKSQFERLKLMNNTKVVVFIDDDELPVLEIASNIIENGKLSNGINLFVEQKIRVLALLDDDDIKHIEEFVKKGTFASRAHYCRQAVKHFREAGDE